MRRGAAAQARNTELSAQNRELSRRVRKWQMQAEHATFRGATRLRSAGLCAAFTSWVEHHRFRKHHNLVLQATQSTVQESYAKIMAYEQDKRKLHEQKEQ